MSLVDIIQFICRNKEVSRVSVESDGDEGQLYLANGQIVHATCGQETGEEALYQLLKWNEGRFHIEKEIPAPTESIQRPWTAVLMQAMQRIDEENERSTDPRGDSEASDILKELADRVPGFVAAYTTDLDGSTFSAESSGAGAFDAQHAPKALFRLTEVVNRALDAVEAGQLKEIITLTEKYRFIIRCFEEEALCLQLILTADGNLGAARMYLTAYEIQREEA
jgi:predicted regulator of Ras-like GTPase activity (Roadblock/LC7/MglB family)